MKYLPGRRREVAQGLTDMPREEVLKLREMWESQGYILPPLGDDSSGGGMEGLGDLVAVGLSLIGIKSKDGCGCKKRQKWLNKMVPFKKKDS